MSCWSCSLKDSSARLPARSTRCHRGPSPPRSARVEPWDPDLRQDDLATHGLESDARITAELRVGTAGGRRSSCTLRRPQSAAEQCGPPDGRRVAARRPCGPPQVHPREPRRSPGSSCSWVGGITAPRSPSSSRRRQRASGTELSAPPSSRHEHRRHDDLHERTAATTARPAWQPRRRRAGEGGGSRQRAPAPFPYCRRPGSTDRSRCPTTRPRARL